MTEALLPEIRRIAHAAGEAILNVYGQAFEVMEKDDASPLTQADLASHRIIRDALARLTPDIPLLSEESADIPFETRRGWSEYWLVDPLDGTREFVNRNGEFTVNIALVENGVPTRGIVYAPDYVVNAGGAIAFSMIRQGAAIPEIERRIDAIAITLGEIFAEAAEHSESPLRAAQRRVERVLAARRRR